MASRDLAELLMAGAGAAVLTELGSLVREGRAAKRARQATAAERLAQVDNGGERLARLEERLTALQVDLVEFRQLLITVLVNDDHEDHDR